MPADLIRVTRSVNLPVDEIQLRFSRSSGPGGQHAQRSETRVIYTSGYTENAIAQHGVLEPHVNFLPKPYVAATLLAKVRDVLDVGRVAAR